MIDSAWGSVQKRWQSHSNKPLILLVRLFVQRIFHGSGDSGEGELNFSMGLLLSLLPLPGGLYALLLFEKYSSLGQWMRREHLTDPWAAALPEEYFFIVLSMAVTGVVAVWRWDSIFPDRRDYANLVPLPLPTRTIFFANLTGILFLAIVLAMDVNAASALLFPLAVAQSVDSFGVFVHFAGAHACVVLLASVFTFFVIFLTVGFTMIALPYAAFRRVSLYLRSAIVGGLVAMLVTSFAVVPLLGKLPDRFIRFLPSVWFLGLSKLLHGGGGSLAALGRVGLISSGSIVVTAAVIYAISYRKCFVRIPESIEMSSSSGNWSLAGVFRALDHTVLTSPFQRAGYRFVVKTLVRSEPHGLILGGFIGLGIVLSSQFLFSSLSGHESLVGTSPTPELFAIPLILSYCVIVGIRFAFDTPTDLRANWMFRLYVDKTSHECAALALKIMLTFILPWVFAAIFPMYTYLWGWRVGFLQTFVVTVWSFLLSKALLLKFRKIPFTCPYPPFRDSAIVDVISYVLGFFAYVVLTAHLEYWASFGPLPLLALVGLASGAVYVLSKLSQNILDDFGHRQGDCLPVGYLGCI
jgi:hypothetical protein